MSKCLVIDVGGTNARVALAQDGTEHDVVVHPTADIRSMGAFLEEQVAERNAQGGTLILALPGPVRGSKGERESFWWRDEWHVRETSLASDLGLGDVHLMNDFAAQALALPHLKAKEVQLLGGPAEGADGGNRVVLGPGTGLGVAGLIPGGHGRYVPIIGEGGHVDLAASTDEELVIFKILQQHFGHVSPERVISGPGLEALYSALSALSDQGTAGDLRTKDVQEISAPQIAVAARGGDLVAERAVSMLSAWLGAVAGDLALTFGATAGVYIGGGVVPALGDLFDAATFRQRFDAKGRFTFFNEAIPTWLVTREHPGLLGLARFATTLS